MRSTTRTIATILGGAFLLAACSGAATTPTPTPGTPPPANPTPTVTTPTVAPTATPVPMTSGQGPQHFVGTVASAPTVVHDYTQTKVGDVTQLRGGVVIFVITTNDVRTGGTVTWHVSADMHKGDVGPLWGPVEVQNFKGTWSGSCTAGGWGSNGTVVAGCWLTGGGAYKGFTAYLNIRGVDPTPTVEGVIFPGAVPKF